MPDKLIQFGIEKNKYDYYLVIIEDGVARELECESLAAVLAEIKIRLMNL